MNLCIFLGIFSISLTLRTILADVNQTKCPGPLALYNSIGCKPINNTIVNGCAYQYNCDHLKSLTWNKCYVNCKAYDIGEKLAAEDSNLCEFCKCGESEDSGVSQFHCAQPRCIPLPTSPGCYYKDATVTCCSRKVACSQNPPATCVVDGKIYEEGEQFSVKSAPDLYCICQPGYKGKNIEPFCATPKHPYCDPIFDNPVAIKNNCAPEYLSWESPQTDCPINYRCQKDQDKVVTAANNVTKKPAVACYFGSLVMNYGDELKLATDNNSDFVKCVCEVGPTPTCQQE